MGEKRTSGWKQLHWWALMFGGVLWALSVAAYGIRAINTLPTSESVPAMMGGVIGGLIALLVFYLVALIVGLVAKKNRTAVSATFTTLSILAATWQGAMLIQAQGARASSRADAMPKIERREIVDQLPEVDVDQVMDQVSEAISSRQLAAKAAYVKANSDLMNANPLNPQWVTEPGDFDKARSAAAAFRKANAEFNAASDFTLERIKSEFESRGVTDMAVIEPYAEASLRNWALQIGAPRLRALDAELADMCDSASDFFTEEWGKWSIGSDGTLSFSDADTRERWHDLYARIQDVLSRQTRAKQELVTSANRQLDDPSSDTSTSPATHPDPQTPDPKPEASNGG